MNPRLGPLLLACLIGELLLACLIGVVLWVALRGLRAPAPSDALQALARAAGNADENAACTAGHYQWRCSLGMPGETGLETPASGCCWTWEPDRVVSAEHPGPGGWNYGTAGATPYEWRDAGMSFAGEGGGR